MIDIDVKADTKDFVRRLTRHQRKQVPYATAVSLTRTVQDAQGSMIAAIPHIFNVTKKWWLKQQPTGIKIRPATKLKLLASVYTDAYFAALQERGGTKTPHAGRVLAIPTDKVPRSRRKAGGARTMANQKKAFVTDSGIYRRKGGKRSRVVEKLFTFSKSAQVRPRFRFKEIVSKVARRRFKAHFVRELGKALRSTRR